MTPAPAAMKRATVVPVPPGAGATFSGSEIGTILMILGESIALMKKAQYLLAASHFRQGIRLLDQFAYAHGFQVEEQEMCVEEEDGRMQVDDDDQKGGGSCDCGDTSSISRRCQLQVETVSLSLPQAARAREELCPLALHDKAISIAFPPSLFNGPNNHHHHNLERLDALFAESEKNVSLLLCALLYNVGLCFQLSALSATRDDDKQVAWQWNECLVNYSAALGLLVDDLESTATAKLFLEMALWNNSGHAYCQTCDGAASDACLVEVELLMEIITTDDDTGHALGFPLPACLACFSLNLLCQQQTQPSSSSRCFQAPFAMTARHAPMA